MHKAVRWENVTSQNPLGVLLSTLTSTMRRGVLPVGDFRIFVLFFEVKRGRGYFPTPENLFISASGDVLQRTPERLLITLNKQRTFFLNHCTINIASVQFSRAGPSKMNLDCFQSSVRRYTNVPVNYSSCEVG